MSSPLTLADIADVRAYERERESFRDFIIDLKSRRRVHVGTVLSFVFESRDTMRFQIQEMARVEKLVTDEQIQTELNVYNALIPQKGRLCATLFIECTSDDQLREWLPKLVGIERAVELRIGEGPAQIVIPCEPEADHAAQLTREEITSAVHYLFFDVGAANAALLAAGPATLVVTHPAYLEVTSLTDGTRAELASDLRG
jgi:Protein of unknown function (DUF3501)